MYRSSPNVYAPFNHFHGVQRCPTRSHAHKVQQILCRLARPQGPTPPQILSYGSRRLGLRSSAKSRRPPKTPPPATIAHILGRYLSAHFVARSHNQYAAEKLIALFGHKAPRNLQPTDVIAASVWPSLCPRTRYKRLQALRHILRLLTDYGAPRWLPEHVPRTVKPKPRNTVVTDAERLQILAAAPLHMRCWLLMCSDLAMRSGTAFAMTPANYDSARRALTFRTKFDSAGTLPVTDALADLFDLCQPSDPRPFVVQLHPNHRIGPVTLGHAFRRLCTRLGITRRIIPHDFRRTTAVRTLELTHDIRVVQALLCHRSLESTFGYVDHDNVPVDRRTLERAKLNRPRSPKP